MNFIADESRERHEFIDATRSEFRDTIQHPSVVMALGQEAVQGLLELDDYGFVPDIRHGVVQLPYSKIGTDTIPLVALRVGESIAHDISLALPTPMQREAIARTIAKEQLPLTQSALAITNETIEKGLQFYPTGATKYTLNETTSGFTYRPYMPLPKESNAPHQVVHGRPLIGLRLDGSHVAATTYAHELTHTWQDLNAPLFIGTPEDYRTRLRRNELGAYFLEATYGSVLYNLEGYSRRGDIKLLEAMHVESQRRAHANSESPLEPTEPMLAAIRNIGNVSWAAEDFMC